MARPVSWEDLLRRADARVEAKEIKEKRDFRRYTEALLRTVPIQALIGITAAFYFYLRFGWSDLERVLLTWVIGITLAATLVTFMINKYKKIIHSK